MTLTVKDEKYYNWKDLVAKAASTVSKEFYEVAAEDLYQDLWVYVYAECPEFPDEYAFLRLLRAGLRSAWEYRRQTLYLSAQYTYRVADVKRLARAYYSIDLIAQPVRIDLQPVGGRDVGSPDSDFAERVAVKLDIEYALEALSSGDRRIVEKAYREGVRLNQTERKRLQRAIERMTDVLNFYRADR